MKTAHSTTASLEAFGPSGIVWVYRTNPVGQFSYGTPGSTFATVQEAHCAAIGFRANHRRAERCSIWIQSSVEGSAMHELSSAGEAEPVKGASAHTRTKSAALKSEGGGSRKVRREKRKADLLEIRAQVQGAKFHVIGVDAIESECPVLRRESFREARARVSRTAARRVTVWKSRGERVVTVLGVEAFR